MPSFPPDPDSGPTLPAAPARLLLDPGRVVGRFRVVKLAGMGGMGEVYQAWDPLLERFVALKAVRPDPKGGEENLERFRREALALAQLNHPHVCQVHDLVTSELGSFIAMEWLEGETLDQVVKQLPRRARIHLAMEVAEGLAAAHAKGLVHRDLKPSNIMVSAGRHAKILDFGLARQEGETQEPVARLAQHDQATGAHPIRSASGASGSRFFDPLTQDGFFLGSPRYASPEQIHGKEVGPMSDIFSLGVILWELLLDDHPFPGEGRERFDAVTENRRRPFGLKGGHPGFRQLLDRMLRTDPRHRLGAAEVASRLRDLSRPLGRTGSALLAVAATLLIGGTLYIVASRGRIADLVKGRPASLAVLPVVNRTGDATLVPELRWVVPDLVGAGLRTSPRLRVVPLESLAKLRTPKDEPLSPRELQLLQDKVGADLCLVSELEQGPDSTWILRYRLIDRHGRIRHEGSRVERSAALADLQALSRRAALDVLKAVDPLHRRPEADKLIPESALRAYALGKELAERGEYGEAKRHLKAAMEEAPAFSHAAVEYGICLQKSGDNACDLAIQWGRWAARAAGNRRSEIQAITQMGILRMQQGRWDESRAAFEEAMGIARAIGDEDFQSALLNNLGYLALERREPDEAEPLLHEALRMHRRLGKKLEEMLTLNNLAVLAKHRGQYAGAEGSYLQVLQTARSVNDRWAESIALNNLGDVAIGSGAYAKAEGLFRQSLQIRRETGNRAGTIIPLANIGIMARIQKQWEAGRAVLNEALNLCRELQKLPMEGLVCFHLGRLELEAGQPEAALQLFRSAEAIHIKLKDDGSLAQALASQAEALLALRKTTQAAPLLRRARELDPEDVFVLRAEARQLTAQGRPAEAMERVEKALAAAKKSAPEEIPSLQAMK